MDNVGSSASKQRKRSYVSSFGSAGSMLSLFAKKRKVVETRKRKRKVDVDTVVRFCKRKNLVFTSVGEVGDWEIAHLVDNKKKRVRYSMVASKVAKHINFDLLRDSSKELGVLLPLELMDYGEGVSLLYTEFTTPRQSMLDIGDTIIDRLPHILKGVITHILALQKRGWGFTITLDIMLVSGLHDGSILPTLPLRNHPTDDISCMDDFKRLKVVLESMLVGKNVPAFLTKFMSCMSLTSSAARRYRLLESPLFMPQPDLEC